MTIAMCPIFNGQHHMVSKGLTTVWGYPSGNREFTGGWYKCQCSERFLCEGYPHTGGAIGKYATEGAIIGQITIGGVSGYQVNDGHFLL